MSSSEDRELRDALEKAQAEGRALRRWVAELTAVKPEELRARIHELEATRAQLHSQLELADKVQDSADSALVRLFPEFSEADHANWGQVVARARGGDVGALSQVTTGGCCCPVACRRLS